MSLIQEISVVLDNLDVVTPDVARRFSGKLNEGNYSRDEDPIGHFGVYFLFHNPEAGTVFLTHHKKSGLWLFPGGHVDKGESTHETLRREIEEELGFIYNPPKDLSQFLLTITRMDAPNYACKTHYDVWYMIQADGSGFKIDPAEFHATRWLSIEEARKLVIDEQNLRALAKLERAILHA